MLARSALKSRFSGKGKRPEWKVNAAYLEWLRRRPCACTGRNPECEGRIQAAHVDFAAKGTPDAKGMSSKVADRWAIPLSAMCHHLQTVKGWPWFIATHLRRDPEKMAAAYHQAWLRTPGGVKWTRDNG